MGEHFSLIILASDTPFLVRIRWFVLTFVHFPMAYIPPEVAFGGCRVPIFDLFFPYYQD